MSRGLSPTYVSSSVGLVQPYLAAYMDFASGSNNVSVPVRLWTGNYDKNIPDDFSGDQTYTGVGTFGGISAISETTEVAAKNFEISLSGIDTTYVSLSMESAYRGRTVAVYLLLFNTDLSSYEKIMIFRGRMDQMTIDENGETSTIKLQCESRLVDMNRQRDIRYTDEAQRNLEAQYGVTPANPVDLGLEFVAGMANKSIYWGNSAPASVGNSGGAGDSGNGDGSNTGSE